MPVLLSLQSQLEKLRYSIQKTVVKNVALLATISALDIGVLPAQSFVLDRSSRHEGRAVFLSFSNCYERRSQLLLTYFKLRHFLMKLQHLLLTEIDFDSIKGRRHPFQQKCSEL